MAIPEDKSDFRGERTLLLAFLLGPLAALANLGVSYSLVPTACVRGSNAMLHLSTAAFVLVSLAGAALGSRYLNAVVIEGSMRGERTRWMGMGAVVLSIFSAMVVLAMEIPNVILRSCQ